MKNPHVFIDSNVWFSAFYKEGVCSELLRSLSKSVYEIVISELVLEEVIKNIKEKVPNALSYVIEYINSIKPTVVKNPSRSIIVQHKDLADKYDLLILVSAIEYKCTYFITGNMKDFKTELIKSKKHLIIITPRDFLLLMTR